MYVDQEEMHWRSGPATVHNQCDIHTLPADRVPLVPGEVPTPEAGLPETLPLTAPRSG